MLTTTLGMYHVTMKYLLVGASFLKPILSCSNVGPDRRHASANTKHDQSIEIAVYLHIEIKCSYMNLIKSNWFYYLL